MHRTFRNGDADMSGVEMISNVPLWRCLVSEEFVFALILLVEMDTADLPYAILENVLIFVDAAAPLRRRSELSGHRHFVPRRLRCLSISAKSDDRLQFEMHVQLAFRETERCASCSDA